MNFLIEFGEVEPLIFYLKGDEWVRWVQYNLYFKTLARHILDSSGNSIAIFKLSV